MDDGLKQRLVGAAVLGALGIIFIPVLFDNEQRRTVDRTSQIPPAPTIAPLEIKPPTRRDDIEPVKPAAEMYQLLPEEAGPVAESRPLGESKPAAVPEAIKPPSSTGKKAVLDEQGVPKAWAVQVASYKTPERANVLRDQLLADDYPAFSRTLKTSKGVVTRVYVGPKINRDKAGQLKRELDKALSLETLVVKFSPSASSK
ncbi:hypothetical protein HBA55_17115 [Pseudomaricurvus alkylphenolicus]|uniref:SPOR domain-containing protein n=1 Tax=Pseudomaricurvus alkylphenolicus TaxID=1306991 RepID=UPI0014244B33|nr:hypothetical protein [Pseudomaricurvus alkylphenolicus]